MKKNKGIKILLVTLIIIVGIALAVVGTIFIMRILNPKEKTPPAIEASKYSTKATAAMQEYNNYDLINSKEYSKTIETILEEKEFNNKYINEYYKIEYTNITDFSKTVNQLLDKKYNGEEINYIISTQNQNIDILLDMEHIDILKFKEATNFDASKIERYLNYKENNNNYDIKTVITYVNIGLDQKGYSNYTSYTTEEAENDLTILVNKYHKLPDDYIPSDLTSLSYNANYKLRKPAADAFEELTAAGKLDNVIFYPFSPYRSFDLQTRLYNNYKNRDGEEKADTYSARPGFSEHQLGLAVDIRSNTLSDNLTSEHYTWMLNNSYKYGFIVRYPKGKQHITQFIEEPWHLRYLGVDLATKVHESGLTYDEYYDIYMDK